MKKAKFVAVIILALIITRLPLLLHPFLDVDEALFAVFARIWQHGGIPYIDAVEGKAMGVYYFYSLASWLSGSLPEINMLAVHLLSIIWTGLTAWVIGRMTTRMSTERWGMWAALLFVLFSSFYIPKMIATTMEVVLLLPLCLAMDLMLRPADKITLIHSFIAGLLVSMAIIIKYQAGIVLPVIVLYFWCVRFSWRQAFLHSLVLGLGCIPLPAIMLWQLNAVGAIPDFLEWSFGHSMRYIQTGAATIHVGRKLLSHVIPLILSTAFIWIMAAWRLKQWRRNPLETGVWIWLFLSVIPVCLGFRFYAHYFLFLIPQLCILTSLQMVHWRDATWQRWRKWIVAMLVVLTAISGAARFLIQPLYAQTHEEYIDDYQSYGEFLKSRTQPDDRILVWGYSPAIYWYAERLPATRFLWSDLLVGRIFGLQEDKQAQISHDAFIQPEVWTMFMSDLERHPPAYIIDMSPTGMHHYEPFPMRNYPQIMDLVTADYVQEADFKGAKLFRRKQLPAIPSRSP